MFSTLIQHRFTHVAAAFGLWWVLSGHSSGLMLSLGLVSSLLTVYLAHRMLTIDREVHHFVINRELLSFWGWLARAIVVANLDVARHVIKVPLKISPTLTRLRTDPKTEVGMATLANSITLTPGTVSLNVDAENGSIAVHALTRDAAADLHTGDMERRARDPGREHRGAQ